MTYCTIYTYILRYFYLYICILKLKYDSYFIFSLLGSKENVDTNEYDYYEFVKNDEGDDSYSDIDQVTLTTNSIRNPSKTITTIMNTSINTYMYYNYKHECYKLKSPLLLNNIHSSSHYDLWLDFSKSSNTYNGEVNITLAPKESTNFIKIFNKVNYACTSYIRTLYECATHSVYVKTLNKSMVYYKCYVIIKKSMQ